MTMRRPISFGYTNLRNRCRVAAWFTFVGLACTIAPCTSAPAFARSYTAHDVGGWMVAASQDGKGCFLTREYDRTGGTTLLLGLDVDGTNRLTVLNDNWSVKPKDRMKLNFRLSNSSYPAHFAVGIASDGKRGFVTSFGATFPTLFAGSRSLDISRGDVPVEQLSLDGGHAAVAELKACVVGRRADGGIAGSDKAGGERIPSDPFGPASDRSSRK